MGRLARILMASWTGVCMPKEWARRFGRLGSFLSRGVDAPAQSGLSASFLLFLEDFTRLLFFPSISFFFHRSLSSVRCSPHHTLGNLSPCLLIDLSLGPLPPPPRECTDSCLISRRDSPSLSTRVFSLLETLLLPRQPS